jgi:hypothetical protein
MKGKTMKSLLTLLLFAIATGSSQDLKTPFAPVPVGQRLALTNRLTAYTTAFRKKDWASLYDLVSDENKISFNKLDSTQNALGKDLSLYVHVSTQLHHAAIRRDSSTFSCPQDQ